MRHEVAAVAIERAGEACPNTGRRLVVVVVVQRVAGFLAAPFGREPGGAAFARENAWQGRGLALRPALVDRHRDDRHVVALLALVAYVAVDVGEDRLDDGVGAAARGADAARQA